MSKVEALAKEIVVAYLTKNSVENAEHVAELVWGVTSALRDLDNDVRPPETERANEGE